MTEVLSPLATTPSPSPSPHNAPRADSPSNLTRPRESRPQPRERIPSYAQSRMSSYSQRNSRSRPQSSAFPAFPSSLSYAMVRDFAYPAFHPMHYGAPPDPPSGATTPGSEPQWNGGRRQSDPTTDGAGSSGGWSAGPWGGDGVMYGEPGSEGVEPLPSTSFGDEGGEDEAGFRKGGAGKPQRKSKSFADMSDYERGRRRESAGYRRSRTGEDMFHFSGGQQQQQQQQQQQHTDPAGRENLRQSRSYGYTGASTPAPTEPGGGRRDSHFATNLPPRGFHAQQQQQQQQQQAQPSQPLINPDTDMPLDAEIPSTTSHYSPQRQSIGPEDEELFAGRSLALYDFEPENANELRLREMQEIMVSYRHGQGWLVAEDPQTGEQGLVPEAYVRLLADLPHYDPETGTFDLEEGLEGEGEDHHHQRENEVEEEGDEEGDDEDEDDEAGGDVHELKASGKVKDDRVDEAYEEAEEGGDDDEEEEEGQKAEAHGPGR